MSENSSELLIYLDVDGPLNPYDAPPHKRPYGYLTHQLLPRMDPAFTRPKPFRVWLNPHHGPMLTTFAKLHRARLIWATTWEDDANTLIGPNIGLTEELEVLKWKATKRYSSSHVYFKTPEIVEHAAGRPFIWFDDEIRQADHDYVYNRHLGNALLQQIHPAVGIRYSDLGVVEDAIDAWKKEKKSDRDARADRVAKATRSVPGATNVSDATATTSA